MSIDEVKASLAMEDLVLTAQEEKVLKDFADGVITFEQLRAYVLSELRNIKAA